ncbi:metallophosphoesterase [Yeosuana sp. MJ-SS3]|uniref:Metallophosphoesterase n=1 Tax=Gilvirhabdus luticola TaxID=3079858 RepID=A0ABU3U5I6_9FLAO|nr:metallophosphoesterase [Yeosuana sp. MJ-SS3]MDU8885682.1 metallophosphoesterase [Yeosuana sp. MJ-SS3]
MRSFSLFTILLLCVAILVVDILAFYWLQTITQLIDSTLLQKGIHILFWVFTIGLITAIIVLKLVLDDINPFRKQQLISSLYGLTVSSFIPKLIFVTIITILYFTNYLFSERQSLIIVPLVGLFSGFLPFFVIVYGIFKAAYRYKTHHHVISFKNLPKSFHNLKIVQISDLHIGSFNYRYKILEKAFTKINHLQPDYIIITGDLVNNFAWELRGWETVFKKLKAKKGKLAILGNHDYGDYSKWESIENKQDNFNNIKQFYNDIGFKLLLNESVIISENNEDIAIIGVENWGKQPFKQYGDLKRAMQNVKNVSFKILLSHDPSHWSEEVLFKTNISLTLSGHTHGMQLGFHYKNMQWSPIKYKHKHWAGLYDHNGQYLYINRGLGWLGFPGRIGMRPEITLIELKVK